ncbi:MAG: hypothetical protein JJ896_09845 [Rhodothermales bacterium]|nr:hypothetical protein [Rhodothermales bacterium]MBO6779942.1 hypothetical protein [Rhodothermales bacterium]
MRTILPIAVSLPLLLGAWLAVSHGSRDLARGQGSIFSGSGNCATCHTPSSDGRPDLRDENGNDVSPPTYWRSTMMANASKDPFWRAKVSAEVAANPGLQAAIEDKCAKCHAPMGRAEALASGESSFRMEQLDDDELALDGVSCTVCHQILSDNLGTPESFSGGFEISHDQTIYGPYTEPFAWPMLAMSGYEPKYGEHMNRSALCATCHTLYTDAVDASGQVVGRIAEQTPYLEWLNSSYPGSNTQCQTCHMPVQPGQIPISNTPKGLDGREPFYRHEFVGGNAFMLGMLRDHGDSLGVTAEPVHFDSTIARTRRMLQSAASLDLSPAWQGDTLAITVTVTNLSGHKLPTGYPSRRAWLELQITSADGDEVFHSGGWDADSGRLQHEAGYPAPHLEHIRSESETQVYESVMGDPDGSPTYGLLRASGYLKDNRIPPTGWLPTGPWSEDTAVHGRAASDDDFAAGDGLDRLEYRAALPDGSYHVSAWLRYQSLAPSFIDEMLTWDTADTRRFARMYEGRDMTPETIAEASLEVGASVSVEQTVPTSRATLSAFPNPAHSTVSVTGGQGAVRAFDVLGRHVATLSGMTWSLRDGSDRPVPAGIYLLVDQRGTSTLISVAR